MEITVNIFTEPTRYTYPKPVLKKAIDDFMKREQKLVYLHDGETPLLADAVGIVKDIEYGLDKDTTAHIELMETPGGKMVQSMIEKGISVNFVPFGIGWANNREVIDYTMQGLCLAPPRNEDTTVDDSDAHNR